MAGDEVRVWFDKAYSKMSLGDFAAAAECFEHVIKHCGDANAARIAEQRIQWYCVPLDAILKKMDECQNPIDIYNVLAELFAADVIYVESEQNTSSKLSKRNHINFQLLFDLGIEFGQEKKYSALH